MAVILALTKLFDDVKSRMDTEAAPATPVPQVFGWKEPARQPRGRIVWVPGDDSNGNLGELAAARNPGRDQRPLATLGELFTVYCEAADSTDLANERAQYQVARELFDAWWRAAYLAAHGTVSIVSANWVVEKKELRYGAAIRVVAMVEAMIPDAAYTFAPVDTGISVDTSLEEVTESTIVSAPARAATTAAIALTGEQTLDGVALVAGDRALVKDQASGEENGIYAVASGAWTRAEDADESAEVPTGLLVTVTEGDTYGGAEFVLTTPPPIVLDTTSLTFEQVET